VSGSARVDAGPGAPGREAGHPADGPAGLTVTDLRVRYGAHAAVDGITLTVRVGQWVALIGPNGAGKTSLLHAASGAVPATGAIRVGDTDLLTATPRRRARRVALVPQRPVIPEAMTVFDYVLLGRTAHLSYLGVEDDTDLDVAADTLDRLGLAAFAHRPVQTLSGGEQQRVVLARALAQETPVLLLDEPTSALDIGHRQQVLELVDQLRHECRLTVLAAMHDLTLAAQYADRLVLLDRGRVAAAGAPRQVLTRQRIADHFEADVHVVEAPDGGLALLPARRGRRRARTVDRAEGH
jgi:iron complex transport system ATP-binding protein